jgi:hypothetical protein
MRSGPPLVVAAVVAALVVAAVVPAALGAPTADANRGPPDPDSDVLGWEDGYWYNESVDADAADGLDDEELEAVVSRGMARVERIRNLEFKKRVPVDIMTRPEFREQTSEQYANVSTADRLHQNVKFEALFMVGEETDAISVLEGNTAGGVLGYYDPGEDRIVVVSEDTESPDLDEITLAQELFHALQDQHFEMEYNRSTEEQNNAALGIIEGDGNYVDYLYEQRCDADWDCLLPDGGRGGAGYDNVGVAVLGLAPYSEGPPFVAGIRERGGWEAVDQVYENPPASTEQLIHPEKYGEDPPTTVRVDDRSDGEWNVLDVESGVDHAAFGEAGLFTMLWYPSYAARSDVVVELNIFDDPAPGLYDYAHRYTAGWDGDRLLPYVRTDSATTNETGYVWKTAWDSPADAEEFAAGYRELLAYHRAEQVGANTYVVPTAEQRDFGGEFGDAIHLDVSGSTVTIVNAPTVEALSGVRSDVTVEETTTTTTTTTATTTTTTTTATDTGTRTVEDTTADGTTTTSTAAATTDKTTESGGSPGFGPAAAALAVVLAAVLARR